MRSLDLFLEKSKQISDPIVLELGTYRSIPGRSTLHKSFVPHYKEYYGTDIFAGEDVDFIADAHRLSQFTKKKYDIIISCSTFEHFKYPHLVAFEISKCLKIGGILYIQTHSTFPLHSFPYDYFRFSTEALSGLFGTKNGIEVVKSDYEFECQIQSTYDGIHDAFLNTNLFGVKITETPKDYVYEFDIKL